MGFKKNILDKAWINAKQAHANSVAAGHGKVEAKPKRIKRGLSRDQLAHRDAWFKEMWRDKSGTFMPVRIVSEANQREHWGVKLARSKRQKKLVELWCNHLTLLMADAISFKFIRYGPKKMDSDNLMGGFKHVRDQLAKTVGVDDGSDFYIWEPIEQVITKPGCYGIRIIAKPVYLESGK